MEQIRDGDVFFFRVPTQMKSFVENPELAKEIGEVIFQSSQGGSPDLWVRLGKRRKDGTQDVFEFKAQDVTEANVHKFVLKVQEAGEGARKRLVKGQVKARVKKQIQILPQQKVQFKEDVQDKVSIENFEQPPDKFAIKAFIDLGGKDGEPTVQMNRYGVIKQAPKEKRETMMPDDLKREIFSLFQKSRFFTLEEVSSYLNQPKEPVRRILEEVCDQNKSTKQFELKRSYQ